jgi:hypothetical protein
MGKFVAIKIIEIVAKNPAIELIHIFTHAGDKSSEECDVGVFSNRGGYYSPLRKTQAIDNYAKLIVTSTVDCPPCLIK